MENDCEVINFYTTRGECGFCSNFYKAKITLFGREWPSTEHFYQAMKTFDPVIQEDIRLETRSADAAALGRSCEMRPDWDVIKYSIMEMAVEAKFRQNPLLADKLLATGDAKLVEKTSGTVRPDPVWGDGVAGEGKNWLGEILMKVRKKLRDERDNKGSLDV